LNCITNEEVMEMNNGSIQLTDNYVASVMSFKQPELRKQIKKLPHLIDLKRTQLQLDREIRNHGTIKKADR